MILNIDSKKEKKKCEILNCITNKCIDIII